MKFPHPQWAEIRSRGKARYLFVDGVLFMGGPFALVLQIVGIFLLREEGQGVLQYLSASKTWVTFFAHATLFGLIMGMINWWRNEKAFAQKDNA